MCGLAGWIGWPGEAVDEAAVLDALRHRGPDGTGVRTWPEAGLLHTRLRIIDLSPTGTEPMANEDDSVFTVFNGEIYNHRELRRELQSRGHSFRGSCDAEVLPHLYEEYGSDLFNRLRGMFSVAIYDTRRQKLLLGRDRFGIKPLFYSHSDGMLAFASELNALRRFPDVDITPDRQAISDYASLLYVPAPRTIFRGVRALEPGAMLEAEITRDGRVVIHASEYHRWTTQYRADLSLDDGVDEADRLLEDAVARQLESDVPLGALLSGGIDSSLVSAAASRRGNGKLETFNVAFPDIEYDETPAAVAVARHISSTHRTLSMPALSGSWQYISELLRHAGQPFADSSMFGVDAVAALVREHVTVALSGDGGDEGFGGYDLYRHLPSFDQLRRLPAPLARGVAGVTTIGSKVGLLRSTLTQRVQELTGADETGVVQSLFSWIRPPEHRRLVLDAHELDPPRRLFERRWDSSPQRHGVERLSAHAAEVNVRLVLPNDFLFKVDIASMRHGLEVRVPMLDEDLVAFGLALPHSLRATRRNGKVVLRQIAERRLPSAVARRPKQGFAVPVDRWVDPQFAGNLRSLLLAPDSRVPEYLNRELYEGWVSSFSDGSPPEGMTRGGLQQRIMMLLALELGLRGGD